MSSATGNEAGLQHPHIEVLVSNLALSHFAATVGSVAMVGEEVRAIGADGIELTHVNPSINVMTRQILSEADVAAEGPINPTYPPESKPGSGIGTGSPIQNEIRQLVRSQHASFAGERPPLNILGRLLPTRFLMPTRGQSLDYMRRTQLLTGDLPGVLYARYEDLAPADIRYSDKDAPFASRLFQPKKDDWAEMGLSEDSTAADIKAVMTRRGLSGVALDLFQILEFDNPGALTEKLLKAGLVDEVHLSVGRTDLVGVKQWRSATARRTRQASRAFVESPEAALETDEGKLLIEIIRKWQEEPEKQRRIVIEKGPWDFVRRRRKLGRIVLSARGLIEKAGTA